MDDRERRRELADFLRTRRARLSPEQAGLPPRTRRRTPGLRREDVAESAGIGTAWYSWLEQGRDIRVSQETLRRIADALQLNGDERAHLNLLAYEDELEAQISTAMAVDPGLQCVFECLRAYPAFIHGLHWNVLAWNKAASALLGDVSARPTGERNLVWHVFTDAAMRRIVVNWEEEARTMLAILRADYDRYPGAGTGFPELIQDLTDVSAEFRQWWPQHEVNRRHLPSSTYMHPAVGLLIFNRIALRPEHAQGLQLRVLTPWPGTDSAAKLQRLLGSLPDCQEGAAAASIDALPEATAAGVYSSECRVGSTSE